VQVITNNVANYVGADKLLVEKHPTLSSTPCVYHCIDWCSRISANSHLSMQPLIKEWTWPNTYITMHLSLVSWGDSQGTRSSCTLELHIFSTNFISLMSLNCCELKLKRRFFLMSGVVVLIAQIHKQRWILVRSGGRVLNQQNFGKGSSFSWWGKARSGGSVLNQKYFGKGSPFS